MNARQAATGHPAPLTLRPPQLDGEPMTEAAPDDDHRCGHQFPPCPDIRCAKPMHDDGPCHATGRDPAWWAAFWTLP